MKNILYIILFLLFAVCSGYGQEVRTFDGKDNNKQHPLWGSKDYYFLTLTTNGFGDTISSLSGKNRPNARLISNMVFDQKSSIPDELDLTDFTWVFGQFIDHDITLVGVDYNEPIPVEVPQGDEHFIPGSEIKIYRTVAAPGTGTDKDNPRRFNNEITSFIDASNVYGSDEKRAAWLRTFKDGKLKTSEGNLLPWNTVTGEFNAKIDPSAPSLANDTHIHDKLFVAGDVRANENPLLTSLHILFLREHNRLCDVFKAEDPTLTDEQLYQKARKWVGAYLQSIVYYEWLPMQGVILDKYPGYNPETDPTVSNLFSAAAFRLGHTMLEDEFLRLDYEGREMKQGRVALKDAYFNPLLIKFSGGIEPFLRGMAKQVQQKCDTKMVDAVRNYLFGTPEQGGLDLATINIMRSRERGLPDYNTIRADFGLEKVKDFNEITKNEELAKRLKFLYGNVDNIDAWVGLLAEDHVEGSIFGPLLYEIVKEQFSRLRDGDRFYFENDPAFTSEDIKEIKNTRLHDIIMRNTDMQSMPYEVFTTRTMPIGGPQIAHYQLNAMLYPNPVSSRYRVKIYVEKPEQVTLILLTGEGRKVSVQKQDLLEGENFIEGSDVSFLPPGAYYLWIETDKEFTILKMIKM